MCTSSGRVEKFAVSIQRISDGSRGSILSPDDYRALLRAVHWELLPWGTFNHLDQAPGILTALTDAIRIRG